MAASLTMPTRATSCRTTIQATLDLALDDGLASIALAGSYGRRRYALMMMQIRQMPTTALIKIWGWLPGR